MARPIDEKIVRMTLDNAKFKNKVSETLKSFTAINEATRKSSSIDLSNIARAVSTIEKRFSASGAVIASIINNLTNSALTMGKNLFAAMVDPLVEGGKKRALNIEQAKFQFEGLGMDVEKTMKSALDAVKGTAFGLDEAAVVASQFGATGMRAGEDMTKALLGISGVAAMTGSSYSDIGNIFTTVAGNGRLMGNDLLRLGSRGVNAAATLAKHFNITEQEVRKMVTAGKVSFEDFAEAMSDAFGEHATKANDTYRGSLSNLRAAFARIGASVYGERFVHLRDIFNATTPIVDDLADALGPVIESINKFSGNTAEKLIKAIGRIDFKKFAELGGMESIVESFWDVVDFGTGVLRSIREAFSRVFPPVTVETFANLTAMVSKLTSKLWMHPDAWEKVTIVLQGAFSVFSSMIEISKILGRTLLSLVPEGAGAGIMDFLVYISQLAIKFNESIKEGNVLTRTIEKLGGVLRSIGEWLRTPIQSLIEFARVMKNVVGTAIGWLMEKLAPVGAFLKDAFSGFGMDEALGVGFLTSLIILLQRLSGFFDGVKSNLENITGTARGLISTVEDVAKGVFGELGNTLKAFQDKIKYQNLFMIAVSIGILAVSLKLLENISIGDIAKGIYALVGSMSVLALGMAVIEKLNFTGGIRSSITITALASATLIMAASLRVLAGLDLVQMAIGLAGLVGITTSLTLAIIALSKFGGKIGTSSISLIALASAITILSLAVRQMSSINTGDLFKSIGALALIFAELALFLVIVKGSKLGPGTAMGLIGLSTSILIIVSAINKISNIDVGSLTKGLVAIGAILLEIALFSKIAGGPQILMAGTGISMVATALSLLMIPVTIMSKMTWEQLAKGLGGMATALLAVGVAGKVASGSILGAVGITVMAAALNMLMPPILIFSAMSWGALIKGFVGLAGGIGTLAGVSMLLSPAVVPMLGMSAALLAIGAAVGIAGVGIAAFGVGLAALAGMTATSVAAIISALSMLIRGFGTLITDIVGFVVDLGVALIGGIGKLVPPLVVTLVDLLMVLLQTIASRTQDFVEAGFTIVISIMKGIQEKVPDLQMTALETVVAVVNGMSDALEQNGQEIVSSFIRLMGEVIIVVIEAGSQMIEALFGWIPGVKKVTGNIGETAEKYIRENFGAKEVGTEKGNDFVDGLSSQTKKAGEAGSTLAKSSVDGAGSIDILPVGRELGTSFNKGVLDTSGASKSAGLDIANFGKQGAELVDLTGTGRDFGTQLERGMSGKSTDIRDTGKAIATSGLSGAESVKFNKTGSGKVDELVKGMDSKRSSANNAGKRLAESGRSGAASINASNTGVNFGTSFARGIESQKNAVAAKARGLASAAAGAMGKYLAIASPSKLLVGFGRFFGDGFIVGIGDRIRAAGEKAKEMAVKTSSALKNSLELIEPEDEEIRIKLILDDDDFDWDLIDDPNPIAVRPDPRFTNNMVASTDSEFRQNRNNSNMDGGDTTTIHNEYKYEIGVTAGGNMSRAEVRKLAEQIQTEIKRADDSDRMSKGEVVFI